MINDLQEWKHRLEQRQDIKKLLDSKKLVIHLKSDIEECFVVIQNGEVWISPDMPDDLNPGTVTITGTQMGLRELINGRSFLSSIPDRHIQTTGTYRNVLIAEAIFGLGI
ncbi:MAG: hypothetical protein H0Z32_10005 [Bacillaceae bacterium]|nr:hypothetical protein [Bacillaceae bacterium]